MTYLSDCKIVHSDLAARNVFMSIGNSGKSSKYLAKIGDLGLGKVVKEENNYYTSNDKSIPVKW
jgi:tRNA A-37 threonylcarbamoyl transferase component Bud32